MGRGKNATSGLNGLYGLNTYLFITYVCARVLIRPFKIRHGQKFYKCEMHIFLQRDSVEHWLICTYYQYIFIYRKSTKWPIANFVCENKHHY